MSQLPSFNTDIRELSLMQSAWASIINPLLKKPDAQMVTLKNVALIIGSTTVNHLLGRKLQGWRLVRVRAAATIYDTQDTNARPELTLVLVSDAAVVVDIEVF